jgi:MFS family permease
MKKTQPWHDKKITLLASIGAGLEYYDFVIYGLLVKYIGKNFFPSHDHILVVLEAFSVFALGYVARPIGGIILGNLGDRVGRKPIFLASLLLMAFSTLMIGLLPTYHSVGMLATILLITFRVFQGIAFGSEIPGTITFIIEHTKKENRGINTGFALSSVSLGASLGTGIVFILDRYFTEAQMLNYGWRIPFILGAGLAIVSLYIRKGLSETPVFLDFQKNERSPDQQPIYQLLRYHSSFILKGIGISLFTACVIVFGIALPAYLEQFYHHKSDDIYLLFALGYIWAACILPFLGLLADKVGRTKQLAWTAGLFIIGGSGLLLLLVSPTLWSLVIFIIIYQVFVCSLANCYLSTLAEIFPTAVRFTGTAFCYNFIFLVAGFVPFAFMKTVNLSSHGIYYVYGAFAGLSRLTLISTLIHIFQDKKKLLNK